MILLVSSKPKFIPSQNIILPILLILSNTKMINKIYPVRIYICVKKHNYER